MVSGFTTEKMPFRTSSIVTSKDMMLRGLTIDNRTGNGISKNTDSFDLTKNTHVTITGNKIYNQDDYLAMQSSANTVFSNSYCCVLSVQIENSDNGIRIKTIIGLKGLVPDAKYVQNTLSNVKNATVIHSDSSKAKGGYTDSPTTRMAIKGVDVNEFRLLHYYWTVLRFVALIKYCFYSNLVT
ncbi:putative polygalacturonase [Phytophthora cinnamomi]|uniref:putative polygalacturonase n=1 Tax=Phytophthora cinnamomi TaxID=4785 RepID=UPI0035596E90